MKRTSFLNWLCGIGLTAATCMPVAAQADTPAFVLGRVENFAPSSFTGTRGWGFSRGLGSPNVDLLITQLGVFDSGGDGLANPHPVGLWRVIDNVTGTLLASTTVPAGTEAPLIDGYRWVPISPVRIPFALNFYLVGAQYSAGDADALLTPRPSFPFAPELVVNDRQGRVWPGPELHYPAAFVQPPCEGCVAELFFEPNLQFVVIPEPSVWLLLAPASFYLLFSLSTRTRAGAAVMRRTLIPDWFFGIGLGNCKKRVPYGTNFRQTP